MPTATPALALQPEQGPVRAATAPPSATAPPPPAVTPPAVPIFGVDFSPVSASGGLDLVTQTRSVWLRTVGVNWAAVEPRPGARHWKALASAESQWRTAVENGLTPIVVVSEAPFWAQAEKGIPCGPLDPAAYQAFGAFLHDLVARYSQPPYNLRYWEIWNEPDIGRGSVPPDSQFGCWGDPQAPYFGGRQYGQMLAAVYPQIKAADSQAQVLVGGLLLDCDPRNPPPERDCTPARYLEGILESEGRHSFDGVSFHAYDFYGAEQGRYGNLNWHSTWNTSGPVLIAKARYLRNLLARAGRPQVYLLNTEGALLCGERGDEALCRTQAFEATKAAYVAQSLAAAQTEGLRANIWFTLTGWRASGLAGRNLQPRPAFAAYQFSAGLLAEAAPRGPVEGLPGVTGYQFDQAGRTIWLLWSLDGQDHAVELPSTPHEVYDLYGTPLPASQTLTVTLAPIYLVWNP